jgi:hypothetical protein
MEVKAVLKKEVLPVTQTALPKKEVNLEKKSAE